MNILVLALSGIGDALMFTPALHLIKQSRPDIQIDALVMFKGVKDIYERNPNFNKVIYFDFIKEGTTSSFSFISQLRGKYDASINVYPSNRKEYNLINFLIGAKKRAGVRYLRKDKINLGVLNNVRIPENDLQHNVKTNIKLCEALLKTTFNEEPPLQLFLTREDEDYAFKFLSRNNIKSHELVIGFHPGSAVLKNHIRRRWEPYKFTELAKRLIKELNAKVLIFGGPEEDNLKEEVASTLDKSFVITIKTDNLAQSASIMKRCGVFVSNDSSLMHIASALQLKVSAIIGPTNPHYIHPWKTEHNIVSLYLECSPCFIYSPRPLICFRDDIKFKCIKELTVDMVYNSVTSLLGNK